MSEGSRNPECFDTDEARLIDDPEYHLWSDQLRQEAIESQDSAANVRKVFDLMAENIHTQLQRSGLDTIADAFGEQIAEAQEKRRGN